MDHKTLAEWALILCVHRNTLLRWHTKGIDGVRLRLWRKGKRWVADEKDIVTFFSALSSESPPVSAPQITAPSKEKLERELDAAGW